MKTFTDYITETFPAQPSWQNTQMRDFDNTISEVNSLMKSILEKLNGIKQRQEWDASPQLFKKEADDLTRIAADLKRITL